LGREGVAEKQLEYIPNGVRMALPEKGSSEVLRREIGARPGEKVLLALGRLSPEKGYPVLLRSFARLCAQGLAAQLCIAGSGPDLEKLTALAAELGIQDSVVFLGVRDDVPELLAAADILVHAAHFEGMPNVVMEAMHAGLPVVATAVDGACELIEDGVDGVLVQPGDERALAEAVDEVLSDPVRMERMGRLASEKMRTGFSVEKMVDRYESLFAGRLAARGAAREWIESRSVNGN
jgi:glycosyltransferase involved in cell wall biosynthesis